MPRSATTDAFRTHTHAAGGVRLRYRTWRSVDARCKARLPVVLFLHGSGERGGDNRAQVSVGLGPTLLRHPPEWPLLAVFPQLPDGASWRDDHAAAAMRVLEDACASAGGDATRVALTGLSRGGYGVWELANRWPGRFKALVPLCGGLTRPVPGSDLYVNVRDASVDAFQHVAARLSHLPCWLVHGARDSVIPVSQSRRMAMALAGAGATVHYRELPEAGHDVWGPAYDDPALWNWLRAHLAEQSP